MSEPLVTIVTSTWKRPRTLFKHAVASVKAQTYPRIEHIVVADGWDPTLFGLLRQAGYGWDSRKSRIMALGRNWSQFGKATSPISNIIGYGATARMVGAWSAAGDYITYLDDDNEYMPEHIEGMVKDITSDDTDLLCCSWRYYNGAIAGAPPPGVGRTDTSTIMHRASLLMSGSWDIHDGYEGDGRMVARWVATGCSWRFREVPTVLLNPYRHGAPD